MCQFFPWKCASRFLANEFQKWGCRNNNWHWSGDWLVLFITLQNRLKSECRCRLQGWCRCYGSVATAYFGWLTDQWLRCGLRAVPIGKHSASLFTCRVQRNGPELIFWIHYQQRLDQVVPLKGVDRQRKHKCLILIYLRPTAPQGEILARYWHHYVSSPTKQKFKNWFGTLFTFEMTLRQSRWWA